MARHVIDSSLRYDRTLAPSPNVIGPQRRERTAEGSAVATIVRALPRDVPASPARVQALLLLASPPLCAVRWEWSGWLPWPRDPSIRDVLNFQPDAARSVRRFRPGRLPRHERRKLREVARRWGSLDLSTLAALARDRFVTLSAAYEHELDAHEPDPSGAASAGVPARCRRRRLD